MNQKNLIQMEIDWTRVVHNAENNPFSQKHLDKNRHKFTGQAAIVFTLLQQGVRLDADYALRVHKIRHLARRIGDLGDGKRINSEFGVDIDREWGLDENGEQQDMLVYFLPENRQKFIENKWIINRPRWWYSELYTPPAVIEQIKKRKNKTNT